MIYLSLILLLINCHRNFKTFMSEGPFEMRVFILFICFLGITISEGRSRKERYLKSSTNIIFLDWFCPDGKSKKTISVGKQDSFIFNTNPDDQNS